MATAEVSGLPPAGEPEVVERDIDGVPLRDHKKIDLKAILGHSPEVEEDDEEEEEARAGPPEMEIDQVAPLLDASVSVLQDDDDEDEEGGCGNSLVQRQRRSSLRAQHHEPPDSPTGERKAVRFADSLGIGLEAIRDLADPDDPPPIPHSAMTALRLRRGKRDPSCPITSTARLVLSPAYPPPAAGGAEFGSRLECQRVLLESSFASSRELTVSGVVRVATSVAGERAVSVRYSTDGWTSHRDVPASYVPPNTSSSSSSSTVGDDGTCSRFVFIIHLPEGFGDDVDPPLSSSSGSDRQGRHLEFAVALHAGGDTYWDNNDGGNYVIDCVMRSREPSVSGDAKTPDDDEFDCPTIGGAGGGQ